jgi:hypothetical protein
MGLDRVHLRKLLKLFMMKENLRATAIRADARDVMKRLDEGAGPGGDFPIPFWRGAKDHAAGRSDLHDTTAEQIEKNWRRKNLYPRFRDGFLRWWNEKRRWINEEIIELPKTIKSSVGFAEIDGVVKVENLLCLRVGDDKHRYIYPYFSDKPPLTPEVARLGLWLMSKALPQHSIEDMRILDVLRGETFSVDKYPLAGDEEEVFTLRYRRILREWRSHLR